jgi:hypothetical protein
MSNTRQIQPIQIWTSSGNKEINVLALTNFFDYHFDNGSGKVEYKMINADPLGATEYFIGTIDIPASVIQQWGASDDIIWEYVASELGLTLIP